METEIATVVSDDGSLLVVMTQQGLMEIKLGLRRGAHQYGKGEKLIFKREKPGDIWEFERLKQPPNLTGAQG